MIPVGVSQMPGVDAAQLPTTLMSGSDNCGSCHGGKQRTNDHVRVDVYRGRNEAAGEAQIIAQMRDTMMRDLRFREATSTAKVGAAGRPHPLVQNWESEAAASHLAADDDGVAKRDALSALLALRAKEIEEVQRERCAHASQKLVIAYQQQVAQLQAALVKKLEELGEAAERNTERELNEFIQSGLPAIQSILSADGARAQSVPRVP